MAGGRAARRGGASAGGEMGFFACPTRRSIDDVAGDDDVESL